MSEERGFERVTIVDDEPGLDALLRGRKDACRALERGDADIEYRGRWIGVEDDEFGWEYVLDGRLRGRSLEEIFMEIDGLESTSEEQGKCLAEAWQNRESAPLP